MRALKNEGGKVALPSSEYDGFEFVVKKQNLLLMWIKAHHCVLISDQIKFFLKS